MNPRAWLVTVAMFSLAGAVALTSPTAGLLTLTVGLIAVAVLLTDLPPEEGET